VRVAPAGLKPSKHSVVVRFPPVSSRIEFLVVTTENPILKTLRWEGCLKNLASGVVEMGREGFGEGGSEPVALSEKKSYSGGGKWVYVFNRRRVKTLIPVEGNHPAETMLASACD